MFVLTIVRYSMVQQHGYGSTYHRVQVAAVQILGTDEGFSSTGPDLESSSSQLSVRVLVAPNAFFVTSS